MADSFTIPKKLKPFLDDALESNSPYTGSSEIALANQTAAYAARQSQNVMSWVWPNRSTNDGNNTSIANAQPVATITATDTWTSFQNAQSGDDTELPWLISPLFDTVKCIFFLVVDAVDVSVRFRIQRKNLINSVGTDSGPPSKRLQVRSTWNTWGAGESILWKYSPGTYAGTCVGSDDWRAVGVANRDIVIHPQVQVIDGASTSARFTGGQSILCRIYSMAAVDISSQERLEWG